MYNHGDMICSSFRKLISETRETKPIKIEANYSIECIRHIKDTRNRQFDDYFIIWTNTLGNLEEFSPLLGNLHPSFKFKMKMNHTQSSFLDIMAIKNNTTIATDIYYIIIGSYSYITFKSCHPTHQKRNISYLSEKSVLQKTIHISGTYDLYNEQKRCLENNFGQREKDESINGTQQISRNTQFVSPTHF